MSTRHPIEQYIKAFIQYTGASKKDFEYKRLANHVLFQHEGITCLISHFDDVKEDYRHYFEKRSYDEIYTETPQPLWHAMIQHLNIPAREMILGIYKEWVIYWSEERNKETPPVGERYERLRSRSWEDLQVLFETIKVDKDNVVESALKIEEVDLVPIIALMIKRQYDDFEIFLDECVELLVEEFGECVTMGETFDEIILESGKKDELFYIYNPIYEFNETSE
jgi:hypothetical protein